MLSVVILSAWRLFIAILILWKFLSISTALQEVMLRVIYLLESPALILMEKKQL